MIVRHEVKGRDRFTDVMIYSLIEGKLVITSDLYQDGVKVEHDVEVIHCDHPLSARQVLQWIDAGAL